MKTKNITFITGNQHKADYLVKYLDFPIEHQKLNLEEIQSLDLKEIVTHKVKQAYAKIHQPVLVEDVSLEFSALGRLPGPFIKFFEEEMSFETLCSLLDGKDRAAIARSMWGYYDGHRLELFEGVLKGQIVLQPKGQGGFGWDKIFIPDGYTITRAEMNEYDYQKIYLQIRPFAKLKKFLQEI